MLAAGCGVVADGTFIRRADRSALAAVAARHGRPLLFLECEADAATIRRRLEGRIEGPSDARWPTYLRQREERDPFGPRRASPYRGHHRPSGRRARGGPARPVALADGTNGAAVHETWRAGQRRPSSMPLA